MNRTLAWFSCGATSAVASKIAVVDTHTGTVPSNWKNQAESGHYNQLQYTGFFDFFDFLNSSRQIKLCGTSNARPESVIGSAFEPLIRRIDEAFRGDEGRIHVK